MANIAEEELRNTYKYVEEFKKLAELHSELSDVYRTLYLKIERSAKTDIPLSPVLDRVCAMDAYGNALYPETVPPPQGAYDERLRTLIVPSDLAKDGIREEEEIEKLVGESKTTRPRKPSKKRQIVTSISDETMQEDLAAIWKRVDMLKSYTVFVKCFDQVLREDFPDVVINKFKELAHIWKNFVGEALKEEFLAIKNAIHVYALENLKEKAHIDYSTEGLFRAAGQMSHRTRALVADTIKHYLSATSSDTEKTSVPPPVQ